MKEEHQEILGEVAKLAWQHKDKLLKGARGLWNFVKGVHNHRKAGKGVGAALAAQVKNSLGIDHVPAPMTATGDMYTSLTKFDPVAVSSQILGANSYHQQSKRFDEADGLVVIGRQILTGGVVTNTATTFLDSTAIGTATITSSYVTRVSPDSFGGKVALLARTYSRFRFRHIRFVYVPRVATSYAGNFVMSYCTDPGAISFATPSYTSMMNSDVAMISPIRECASIEMNCTSPEWYYQELDTTGASTFRQTAQGLFMSLVDDTVWTTGAVGAFYVEYVLEICDPVFDMGFTISLVSRKDWEDFLTLVQGVVVHRISLQSDSEVLYRRWRALRMPEPETVDPGFSLDRLDRSPPASGVTTVTARR